MAAVPRFSGRGFRDWLIREDLRLSRRDATGVRDDWAFGVLLNSCDAAWFFLGPAGMLGVGAASMPSYPIESKSGEKPWEFMNGFLAPMSKLADRLSLVGSAWRLEKEEPKSKLDDALPLLLFLPARVAGAVALVR